MSGTWLSWAGHIDLSAHEGNGPFGPGRFLGVVQHVNVGDTSDDWIAAGGGSASVCPNFQVHTDGRTTQFLPIEHAPWCQRDGNANYGAIECAGDVGYPMNPAQLASIAKIVRAYHDVMGMPLQLADAPGQRGYGTHVMGGAAWGGHTCPGSIRSAQRPQILAMAAGTTPAPAPQPVQEDNDMALFPTIQAFWDGLRGCPIPNKDGQNIPLMTYMQGLDQRLQRIEDDLSVKALQDVDRGTPVEQADGPAIPRMAAEKESLIILRRLDARGQEPTV